MEWNQMRCRLAQLTSKNRQNIKISTFSTFDLVDQVIFGRNYPFLQYPPQTRFERVETDKK